MKHTLIAALCIGWALSTPLLAAGTGCSTPAPLALRVRFADEQPRGARLESSATGLRLLDPLTNAELWSAGAGAAATQQIADMNVTFGASLTAVHLDADGVHDRLYAGDQSGRLWRFDLRAGAVPSNWVRATVLADLRAPRGGRGFVAAPDVTRIDTADGKSWLNIAIGTANTAVPRMDHRFYVLRDALAAAAATPPMTEADLELLTPPLGVSSGNAHGYYLSLGNAQVLARALTLDGQLHFTLVDSGRNLLEGCATGTQQIAVPVSVAELRAMDGAVADRNGVLREARDLRKALPGTMPANAAVELETTPRTDGRLLCHVHTEQLPGCFLDTRPRRSWWRREDAD